MEPLTEEGVERKSRSKASTIDRVSIGRVESEKLELWIKQMQETSKGFLLLTKSDLVNFLIREHKDELSPKELAQVRADNYDPIRHINWITQELKTALAKKDLTAVAMLQTEIKGIELSIVAHASEASKLRAEGLEPSSTPRPKRKRTQKSDAAIAQETMSIADLQADLSKA